MNRTALLIVVVLLLLAAGTVIALAGTETVAPEVFLFSSGGSWLGVHLADINAERAGELKLDEAAGVEILSLVPGSPAEDAGLEKGDVVLRYQGAPVVGVVQLIRLVRETPPGRTVEVTVSRAGAKKTMQVKVAERERDVEKQIEILRGPHDRSRIVIPHIEIPDIDIDIPDIDIEVPDAPEAPHAAYMMAYGGRMRERLGISVDNLTDQLGEHFGVKDGAGVLVRSVKSGSRGEEAGLQAGDVIIRVDDDPIDDTYELRRALRERSGEALTLTVVRDKRERTLNVAAPEEGERSLMEAPAADERARLLDEAKRMRLEIEAGMAERAAAIQEARRALDEARRMRLEAISDTVGSI